MESMGVNSREELVVKPSRPGRRAANRAHGLWLQADCGTALADASPANPQPAQGVRGLVSSAVAGCVRPAIPESPTRTFASPPSHSHGGVRAARPSSGCHRVLEHRVDLGPTDELVHKTALAGRVVELPARPCRTLKRRIEHGDSDRRCPWLLLALRHEEWT